MFTLACFLSLLATILLILIAKNNRMQSWLGFAYVAVVLVGLTTHVFFWLILGSHILWTLSSAWSRRQPFPRAGRLEILALILGSPLLAVCAYQTGSILGGVTSDAGIYAREFMQFAFMFPLGGFSSGACFQDCSNPINDNPHLSLARWAFFLPVTRLVVSRYYVGPEFRAEAPQRDRGAVVEILDAGGRDGNNRDSGVRLHDQSISQDARASRNPADHGDDGRRAASDCGARDFCYKTTGGGFLHLAWFHRSSGRLLGTQGLVLILAVVPFSGLAAISVFKDIFNARGMLLMGPYLLLALAMGIVRVCRQYKLAAAVLLVVIGIARATRV